MTPKASAVIAQIEAGFADTPYPGADFLQGSFDGSEPAAAIEPFRRVDRWQAISSEALDKHDTALAFFSAGGFRFFLPAYIVADLRGILRSADPIFHLTSGFTTTKVTAPVGGRSFTLRSGGRILLNPRRYGAITFEDYARYRLSVFSREEARALVSYLRYRRDTDDLSSVRDDVNAALLNFWNGRTANAPTTADLAKHVAAEADYFQAISEG